MLKKGMTKISVLRERKNIGKGSIVLNSMEEFDTVFDNFKGQMVSPGGAAARLGVSRSFIHHLEKEGKIRAYRIGCDDIQWDKMPLWAKLLVSPRDVYIYIPDEDIEKVRQQMLKKAEDRINELKGFKK